MGLFDNLKRYVRAEDYEEDENELENRRYADTAKRWQSTDVDATTVGASSSSFNRTPYNDANNNRVVNIHTVTKLSVVLVKPDRYENAADIADHLRDKRTVVLNLEHVDRDTARRTLDFLSGVAYANEGKIKRVANSTYIITPYNVDIQGDLIDELENNGLHV